MVELANGPNGLHEIGEIAMGMPGYDNALEIFLSLIDADCRVEEVVINDDQRSVLITAIEWLVMNPDAFGVHMSLLHSQNVFPCHSMLTPEEVDEISKNGLESLASARLLTLAMDPNGILQVANRANLYMSGDDTIGDFLDVFWIRTSVRIGKQIISYQSHVAPYTD